MKLNLFFIIKLNLNQKLIYNFINYYLKYFNNLIYILIKIILHH